MSITPSLTLKTEKKRTTDLSVQISDLLIETVLDRAFLTDTFEINPHPHTHPYFELHIGLFGEYKLCFVDGASVLMRPSTVCLIPPEMRHHAEKLSENTQSLALRFIYRRGNEHTKLAPLYEEFHSVISRCDSPVTNDSMQIFQLVTALRRETLTEERGADAMETLLLSEIYISLLRILSPAENAPNKRMPSADNLNTRYIKIEAFLSAHFHEPITQKDLADALFLGTKQLARILKSIYGVSFREKLTEIRLDKAMELITETELSLEKIAEMVGYESYSGFYLAFRNKYGASASELRKNLRNKT